MFDQSPLNLPATITDLTPTLKEFLNTTRSQLKGHERRQFMAGLVYYHPYHSKYNPTERVWGVLENYWKGELLNKTEKALGLCRTMTWKGKNPVVKLFKGVYPTGIRLAKSAMNQLENRISRIPGIEKWAVDIPCYQE